MLPWLPPGGNKMVPAPSILLPNQDADYISHIALDIGGSLIKLIYFSPDPAADAAAQFVDQPAPPRAGGNNRGGA